MAQITLYLKAPANAADRRKIRLLRAAFKRMGIVEQNMMARMIYNEAMAQKEEREVREMQRRMVANA